MTGRSTRIRKVLDLISDFALTLRSETAFDQWGLSSERGLSIFATPFYSTAKRLADEHRPNSGGVANAY
jgi:hypothetical protein